MTVRDTSIAAYAVADRALIRSRILGLLINQGEMTRRQVADQLGLETACVAGRVNELMRAGAVIETCTKQCPISKVSVHWIAAAPKPEQVAA